MTWADPTLLETVTVVGPGTPLAAMVSERAPGRRDDDHGQTGQTISLLLPSGEQLDPPMRLLVRGRELRVLGTQQPPMPGEPSLVTCERVNLDLPDEVRVGTRTRGELNRVTNKYDWIFTQLWSGPANVEGAAPTLRDVGGERAPVDRVEIALPLDAAVRSGLVVEVLSARHPSLAGARYAMAGEVDSSTSALRRVVAYRQED